MTHMTLTCFVISEKMSTSTMKKEDISMQHSILNTVTAISFFYLCANSRDQNIKPSYRHPGRPKYICLVSGLC